MVESRLPIDQRRQRWLMARQVRRTAGRRRRDFQGIAGNGRIRGAPFGRQKRIMSMLLLLVKLAVGHGCVHCRNAGFRLAGIGLGRCRRSRRLGVQMTKRSTRLGGRHLRRSVRSRLAVRLRQLSRRRRLLDRQQLVQIDQLIERLHFRHLSDFFLFVVEHRPVEFTFRFDRRVHHTGSQRCNTVRLLCRLRLCSCLRRLLLLRSLVLL